MWNDFVPRKNEGCKDGEVLKSVLSNRGLGINAECLYEGVIVPTASYRA